MTTTSFIMNTTSLRSSLALLAALSLAACGGVPPSTQPIAPPKPQAAAKPEPPPQQVLVEAPDAQVLGEWVIEQARSAPVLDKTKARLVFGPEGALSGHGGCNALRGRYTLEGNRLAISQVAATRMACSPALMEQEDRILTALERAARATVPPHGFLTLQDADGAVLMRASRQP